MKRILSFAFGLMLLLNFAHAQSNTTYVQDLNQVVSLARDIKGYARDTRDALRTLAIDYFQFGNQNPNVAAYLAVMDVKMTALEIAQDDIAYYASSAALKNPALDVSDILTWASEIEGREDYVRIESQNLANAIAQGNTQAARAANIAIRSLLQEQIALANDIITEANNLKTVPQVYKVRIELVNSQGQLVGSNGLQGYYAQDLATSLYIWPDSQDGTTFHNLPAGTYRFGAINGYFDGAGSATVTLDDNLVNGNGEIVVQLVYWSE